MKKVFADHGLKEGDDYILIPWDYSEGNLKIRPREGQDITVAYSKEVDDYNAGRRAGETSAGETIENKIRKTAREIAERKRPTRKIGFQ